MSRPPDDPFGGRLRAVPILTGRFEFAVAVRQAFAGHRPTDMVLDLPPGLVRALGPAVARLPCLSAILLEDLQPPGELVDDTCWFLVEPTDARVEAARLAAEHGVSLHGGDRDAVRVASPAGAWPDPHAIESIGLEAWAAPCLAGTGVGEGGPEEARPLAHRVAELLADPARRVLLVAALPRVAAALGLLEASPAVPFGRPARLKATIHHLHPDSTREVLSEIPWLAAAWERRRCALPPFPDSEASAPSPGAAPREDDGGAWPLSRHQAHLDLVRAAREAYRQDLDADLAPGSLANLFRWSRNISLLEGALAPDFYTLVLAARGVADDDFAWHLWDQGSAWPWSWPETADGRPVIRLSLDDLDRDGRRIRFERRIRHRRRSPLRLVRARPREPRPGAWKDRWEGLSICSYPPEDVIIEGYGRFLAERAKGLLAADRRRTEPFAASTLDGIDVRETIRNRAHDGRLYVVRQQPLRGRVGAVVLAFDAEDRDGRHSYRMTWQGEHDQESDMALYSTPPGERLVGPGISRCEYGGFLMTWPPGRMFFVWEDPEFFSARTPAEHLLLAGIDYALERMVVYVAARPPRSFVHQFAARRGRQVLYLPIGQLAPATLRRLRTFHVLDGREVRAYARDFIS